jgi:hypothetical protein
MLALGKRIAPMRSSVNAERLARQARIDVDLIRSVYQAFFPDVARDGPRILIVLEAFLVRHPRRSATREQTAFHEAGHFVSFERLGLGAFEAKIRRSAGCRFGWGGEAFNLDWRTYRRPQDWDAGALWREAATVLAGPIAEERLGGGDALSNFGELVEASVLAFKAAELQAGVPYEVLREVVIETVSLVEHSPEILRIAGLLKSRRRVNRWQPSVQKILAGIPQGPIDATPLSTRGQALSDKIMGAFEELCCLIREVATAAELEEAGL